MSSVAEISQQLFAAFERCVPLPEKWSQIDGKYATEDMQRSLDRFYDQARELRRVHRPGIFARARIALALQRQLLAVGYPAELVRQILFSLILAAFVGSV